MTPELQAAIRAAAEDCGYYAPSRDRRQADTICEKMETIITDKLRPHIAIYDKQAARIAELEQQNNSLQNECGHLKADLQSCEATQATLAELYRRDHPEAYESAEVEELREELEAKKAECQTLKAACHRHRKKARLGGWWKKLRECVDGWSEQQLRIIAERDSLSNLVTDYGNKLGEWQELTGFSCPSACADELANLRQENTQLRERLQAAERDHQFFVNNVSDWFMREALVAIAGAVPTPEQGYIKDGGLQQLLADIKTLRRDRDTATQMAEAAEQKLTDLRAQYANRRKQFCEVLNEKGELQIALAAATQRAEAAEASAQALAKIVGQDQEKLFAVQCERATIKQHHDALRRAVTDEPREGYKSIVGCLEHIIASNPASPAQQTPAWQSWAKAVLPPLEAALAGTGPTVQPPAEREQMPNVQRLVFKNDAAMIESMTKAYQKLKDASAKYRCMVRSGGPHEIQFQAGKELDAALAGTGEPEHIEPCPDCHGEGGGIAESGNWLTCGTCNESKPQPPSGMTASDLIADAIATGHEPGNVHGKTPTFETLLPCPFCGKPPRMATSGGGGEGFMSITFYAGQCYGCCCAAWSESREDAVKLWNRRHSSKAKASGKTPGQEVLAGQILLPQWAMDEAYRIITENTWGWGESASDDLTEDQEKHWHILAIEITEIVERRQAAWEAAARAVLAQPQLGADKTEPADVPALVAEIKRLDALAFGWREPGVSNPAGDRRELIALLLKYRSEIIEALEAWSTIEDEEPQLGAGEPSR